MIKMANAQEKPEQSRHISLVTGATCALGVAVVKKLVARGDEVRAIIRDSPETNPEWKYLPSGVKPYVANLADVNGENSSVLQDACRDVDEIFHFASISQSRSNKFSQVVQINVLGTENLMSAYLEANKDSTKPLHIIYSSSTAVYGYKRGLDPITEASKTAPANPYGESKLLGEQVIRMLAQTNAKVHYTILRIGVIYGPGYAHNFNHMFKNLATGDGKVVGKGTNHLTLIHIDDVVDAIMLCSQKGGDNQIFNLTDGIDYTQKQLLEKAAGFLKIQMPKEGAADMLVKLLGANRDLNKSQFQFITSDRIVNIDKIQKATGFKPKRSIDVEGKLLVDEFLKRHKIVGEQQVKT